MTTHKNFTKTALFRALKAENRTHEYIAIKQKLVEYFGVAETRNILTNLTLEKSQSLSAAVVFQTMSSGLQSLWEILIKGASGFIKFSSKVDAALASIATTLPSLYTTMLSVKELLKAVPVYGILLDILNVFLAIYYRVPWSLTATLIARLGASFVSAKGLEIVHRINSMISIFSKEMTAAFKSVASIFQVNTSPKTGPATAFVEFFKSLCGMTSYDDRELTTIIQKMRAQIGLFKDMQGVVSLIKSCIKSIGEFFNCSKVEGLDPYAVLTEAEALLPEIGKAQLMTQFGKNKTLCSAIPKHYKKLHELRSFFYGLNRDKPEYYQRYLNCTASYSLAMLHIESFSNSHNMRTTPPIVHFYGAPGVGKTRLVRILAKQLHRLLHKIPDDVETVTDYEAYYSRNLDDPFQDAYNSQTVYYYDDPNQQMSTDVLVPFLKDIIAIGQDASYQLKMSSVEMKSGGFFNSPFVFLTTNGNLENVYTLCQNHIQDLNAVRRRITYNVEVIAKSATNSLDDWHLKVSKFAGFHDVDGKPCAFYDVADYTVEEFRDELLLALAKNQANSASIDKLTVPKNVKVPIPSLNVPQMLGNKEETEDASDSDEEVPVPEAVQDILDDVASFDVPAADKMEVTEIIEDFAIKMGVRVQSKITDLDALMAIKSLPYFGFWDQRFAFTLTPDKTMANCYEMDYYGHTIYLTPTQKATTLSCILKLTRNNLHWLFTNKESFVYSDFEYSWGNSFLIPYVVASRAFTPTFVDTKPPWFQKLVAFLIGFWVSYSVAIIVLKAVTWAFKQFWPSNRVVPDDAQVDYPKDKATHQKGILLKPEIKRLNIAQVGGTTDVMSRAIRQIVFCDSDRKPVDRTMMHSLAVRKGFIIYPFHMWSVLSKEVAFFRVYDFYEHKFTYVPIDEALCRTVQIGEDIVTTDLSTFCPDARDIVRHFATRSQVETLSDEQGVLLKVEFNQPKMPIVERVAAPLRKVATVKYQDPDGTIVFNLTGGLKFKFPTQGGDCGFPYIHSFKEKECIIGFHVAGDGRTGSGHIVTREILESAIESLSTPVTQGVVSGKLRSVEPVEDEPRVVFEPQQEIKILKIVPKDHASFMPFKSVVEKNETFFDLLTGPDCPEVREPTRLRPFINNSGDRIDPVSVAASKLQGTQQQVSSENVQIFTEVSELYMNTWPLGKTAKLKSVDEALNGSSASFKPINMNKSAGINQQEVRKPGKYTFIRCSECKLSENCNCSNRKWELTDEFQRTYAALLAGLERGDDLKSLLVVFMDCLKSEVRKSEKVQKGASRLFSAGPFELLVLVRQYFGSFMETFNANPLEFGSGIGLNPHSFQWKTLFDLLNEKDKAIFADAKNWDAGMIYQLIMIIHDRINDWYRVTRDKDSRLGLPVDSDVEFSRQQRVRLEIAKRTYNTVRLLGNVLYICPGNPSGQALTGIINTLYNNVVTRSAIVVSCRPLVNVHNVFEFTRLSATGDDIVITHDIPGYSCAKHRDAIAQFGIQLTPADKSADFAVDNYTIFDGDYLKRRFRKDGPLVFAPLEPLSVLGMCNWKSSGMSDKFAAKAVYDCLSIEAMHHGKEFFDLHTKTFRDFYAQTYRENLPHKDFYVRVGEFKSGAISYEFAQSGASRLLVPDPSGRAPGSYEGSIRKVGFSTKASSKGEYQNQKMRFKFEGHSMEMLPTVKGSNDQYVKPKFDPIKDYRPNANHRNALKLPSQPSIPLPPQVKKSTRPIAPPVPSFLLATQPRRSSPPIQKPDFSSIADTVLVDEMFGNTKISIADKSFKPKKNKGLKVLNSDPAAKSFENLVQEAMAKQPFKPKAVNPLTLEVFDKTPEPKVNDTPQGPREMESFTPFKTKMPSHKNKQGSEIQRKISIKDPSIAKKKRPTFKKEFRPSVPFDAIATRVLNEYNFASYQNYLDLIQEYNMFRNQDQTIFGDTSFHYAQNNLVKLVKSEPQFSHKNVGLSFPLVQVTIKIDDQSIDAYGMSSVDKNARKLACLNAINQIKKLGLRQVPDYMLTNIKIKTHVDPDTQEKNLAQSGYSGQKMPTDDSIQEKANVAIQEDSVSASTTTNTQSEDYFNMINPFLDMTPHELLSRQVLAGSFTISTTSTPLVCDLGFPDMALTYYHTLLNRFAYFHCDFEIEARLNANFSQQGLLHWSFIPANTDRKRYYRSASMQILQHVANADSVTITIPGLCYNNGFNTISTGPFAGKRAQQTGNLLCHILSPIREANVSTPVSVLMTVYLRLKNVKCYAFKAQSGGKALRDTQLPEVSPEPITTERMNKGGSVSTVLDTVSQISSTMAVLPQVGPFASSVSALSSLASQVTRFFGHSMSRSLTPSTFVAPRSTPIVSNSHGTLPTDVMGLSADSSLATDSPVTPGGIDYNLYDNYKLIPMALIPIQVGKTTPLGTIATINLAPQFMTATYAEGPDLVIYTSAIADLARSHSYWTGDIKFSIVVVGNRFTNFRLRAYWKPPYVTTTPTTTTVSDFANRIINVDGPTTSSFTIPFLGQQPWLSTSTSLADPSLNCNGQLVLELLTQPQLLGTVDVPAEIFIFVSGGETMLFSVPCYDTFAQVGSQGLVVDEKGNNNDLIAHFQTVFPGIIDSRSFVTDRVNMSDVSCSFTERYSRPTWIGEITVTPGTVVNPTVVNYNINDIFALSGEEQFKRLFVRFACHRGSLNFLFQPRVRTDVRLMAQYNRGSSTTNPVMITRPFSWSDTFNKPYVHITVPDYNTALYRCPGHPETYKDLNQITLWAYSTTTTPCVVDVYMSLGDDFRSSVLVGTPPNVTDA